MSILAGDTGKSAVGSLKTFTLSAPTPTETFLNTTPITLPNTEPATSQVSFTVTSANMIPTVTPTPLDYLICPVIQIAGKIGASTTTLNYKVYLNSVQISSGNNASLAATLNWTYNIVNQSLLHAPIKAGDVIEVKLWSNQTDTLLDYYSITFYTCRLVLAKAGTIVKDVIYSSFGQSHTLSLGRSPSGFSNASAVAVYGVQSMNLLTSGTVTIPALTQLQGANPSSVIFGLFTVSFGDSSLRTFAQMRTHATNHPFYDRNILPNSISFREVLR